MTSTPVSPWFTWVPSTGTNLTDDN
uniref:Uncharacterized protein n=1 Tax=Arundo donax TaxID=35708 RepID=A0A0A9HVD9_ARUDO